MEPRPYTQIIKPLYCLFLFCIFSVFFCLAISGHLPQVRFGLGIILLVVAFVLGVFLLRWWYKKKLLAAARTLVCLTLVADYLMWIFWAELVNTSSYIFMFASELLRLWIFAGLISNQMHATGFKSPYTRLIVKCLFFETFIYYWSKPAAHNVAGLLAEKEIWYPLPYGYLLWALVIQFAALGIYAYKLAPPPHKWPVFRPAPPPKKNETGSKL